MRNVTQTFAVGSLKHWLLSGILLLVGSSLFAQGVTTAGLNGIVTDDKGEALPGANVVAVHEPTGTHYGAAARTSGAFNLPNMKIGGPYTVTTSFIGHKNTK